MVWTIGWPEALILLWMAVRIVSGAAHARAQGHTGSHLAASCGAVLAVNAFILWVLYEGGLFA